MAAILVGPTTSMQSPPRLHPLPPSLPSEPVAKLQPPPASLFRTTDGSTTPATESSKRSAPDDSTECAGKRLAVAFTLRGGNYTESAGKLPMAWAVRRAVLPHEECVDIDESGSDEESDPEHGDKSEAEEATKGMKRAVQAVIARPNAKRPKPNAGSSKMSIAPDCSCVCSAFLGLKVQEQNGCTHRCRPSVVP